ncbi:MAG: exonuclease domain-containing protein [Candidatus Magasanikbacteria bacterium]|nr:exonuclease domain-containing protein [Candidatus Magasanikbacteria bacterium]
MKSDKKRIFVDLEYVYPGMTRESGRPTEKEQRQVTQIAAILVNSKTNEELGFFDILVKPPFTKILPEFSTELTGITQKQMDKKGINFKEALEKFYNFCGDNTIWTFNADFGVFLQNCNYHNISFLYKNRPFIKVKQKLPFWGVDPDKYSSGTLYKAVGLKMDGHTHNALHDVRSMSAAVHKFEQTIGFAPSK